MDPHQVMLLNMALVLLVSVHAVFCRDSNFKYKEDKPVDRLHDLYVTTKRCNLDVNLYIKAKAILLKNQLRDYVEPQENIIDEPGPKVMHDLSFLIVQKYGSRKNRDVYKVSMKSNTTEKTGISIKGKVLSIVYDQKSNTLFWSQRSGIFKQEMDSNSKKKTFSSQTKVADLNIFYEKLFYSTNYGGRGCIRNHDLKKRNSSNIWLSLKKTPISHLVIDDNIGCWIEDHTYYSLKCVEMLSKKYIFTRHRKIHPGLALIKKSRFGLLVYLEKNVGKMFCIKVVKIIAGNVFGAPKSTIVEGFRDIKVFPGFLVYSFNWQNQVELWEINQNGSIGRNTFTTWYPSPIESILLVALM